MAQPAQPSPEQPLKQLQGTMNMLLSILGGFISDPDKRKDFATKQTIGQLIPKANTNFHDALDKLDADIMRAKMVMRRDLMILRATKAQAEAEANAKPVEALAAVEAAHPVADNAAQEPLDLIMADEPAMGEAIPKEEQKEVADVVPEIAASPPTSPKKEPGAATTTTTTTTAQEEPSATADDAPKEETAPTDDGAMDEFDDIFGEFAQTSPNNDEPVNSLDMTDFPDTNADVSSLLPGLESYANMPDASMPDTSMADSSVPEPTAASAASLDAGGLDFSMLGIPGQDASENKKPQEGQPEDQVDDGGQDGGYDNTFEDLFDLDYELGLTGDGDGDANNNDLDEWMKSLE